MFKRMLKDCAIMHVKNTLSVLTVLAIAYAFGTVHVSNAEAFVLYALLLLPLGLGIINSVGELVYRIIRLPFTKNGSTDEEQKDKVE